MATVAIDARKYFDYGIGSYIQNLISSLSILPTSHTFGMIVGESERDRVAVPEGWNSRVSSRRPYSMGEFLFLGHETGIGENGLLHEPHYTLPSGLRGRSVVTIHDLIQIKLTQYFSPLQRGYAKWMMGYAVRNAGAIIAVSQKTKEDILETFSISEDKVYVVYHGIRPVFRSLGDRAAIADFKRTKGLERPFVLYVGNVKPHKNIPALLTAFEQVRKRQENIELVFAGGDALGNISLRRQASELGILTAIRDLHRLSEEELVLAYNAAEVLVLPSLYEGFGFPVLEAMACGLPVVAAHAGSLPEIAGTAAMMVDPTRPDSIAESISTVLEDSEIRRLLIAGGHRHVAKFTWEQTARATLGIYEKVFDRCGIH